MRLGFREAAACMLEAAEVVVDRRRVGMLLAGGSLDDRKGAAVQRLCLVEAARELEDDPEPIERVRGLERVGPERSLGQRDCLAELPLRFDITTSSASRGCRRVQQLEPDAVAVEPLRRVADRRQLALRFRELVSVEVNGSELQARLGSRERVATPCRRRDALARRGFGVGEPPLRTEGDDELRKGTRAKRRVVPGGIDGLPGDALGRVVVTELLLEPRELEQERKCGLDRARERARAAVVAVRASLDNPFEVCATRRLRRQSR